MKDYRSESVEIYEKAKLGGYMSRAGTTGAMPIVEDGDNARSTSGAAQATATPPGVFVFGAGSPLDDLMALL